MNNQDPKFYLNGYPRSGNNFLKCLIKTAWPKSFDDNYLEANHDPRNIQKEIFNHDATVIPIRNPYDSILSHLNILYKKIDSNSWQHYHSKKIFHTDEMVKGMKDVIEERVFANNLSFEIYEKIKNSATIFDLNFISKNVEKIPAILFEKHKLKIIPKNITNEDVLNTANTYLPKEIPFVPIQHKNKNEIKFFLDENKSAIYKINRCNTLYNNLLNSLNGEYYGL